MQVGNWKKELLNWVPELFDRKNSTKNKDTEQEKSSAGAKGRPVVYGGGLA